ncbi:MAG: hypothetical protein R3B90_06230 [Planctomycetaceae bacterium]
MFERQVELSIGDVLQVGGLQLTILDIEGDEIHVQLDDEQQWDDGDAAAREMILSLPR